MPAGGHRVERGVSSQAERKPSASGIPTQRALPKPSFLLSGQTLSPHNHCTWLSLWRLPGYGRMSGEVAGNSHTRPIGGVRDGQGHSRDADPPCPTKLTASVAAEHSQDPAEVPVTQEGAHDPNPASSLRPTASPQNTRDHASSGPGWAFPRPGPRLLAFSCSYGHRSWPDPGLGLVNHPLCWGRPGRLGAAVLGALGSRLLNSRGNHSQLAGKEEKQGRGQWGGGEARGHLLLPWEWPRRSLLQLEGCMGLGWQVLSGLGQICLQDAPASAGPRSPRCRGQPGWGPGRSLCAQGPFAAALGHCSDLCQALVGIFKGKRPWRPQNRTRDKDKACLGQNSLSRPCTECARM
ncbi:uncharacterized protein LOC115938135 [Leptonychotes weddellii]|uniref:Uncharacterized protein LOC115938135 n=1 Tax=Leptonychotes weddellii TaxID=9713 RepID=A0A7F8Q7R7_LEPWE|nr:uncharacterized protein LOC115938135 [Leptonychotes weddellii]